MEAVTTFGLPSWSDNAHPCWACKCSTGNWNSLAGMTLTDWPWELKTIETYNHACEACEIRVTIASEIQLQQLRANLQYHKESSGPRGRALVRDMPEHGLLRKDRLEPSDECCDIGDLDVRNLPLRLTFWRRSCETAARHRNPLFSNPDVIPLDVLSVGEMHCMHLGVYKFYVAKVFTAVLEANVYDIGGGTAEHRRILGVSRLRADRMEWYKQQQREGSGEPLYPLGDLRGSMFNERTINTKAAETGSLVPFAVHLATTHDLPNKAALQRCGEALLRYHSVTRSCPRRLNAEQRQDM